MHDALPPLALTAVATAVSRAAESRRSDRLFDDSLAERFVAAAYIMTSRSENWTQFPLSMSFFEF